MSLQLLPLLSAETVIPFHYIITVCHSFHIFYWKQRQDNSVGLHRVVSCCCLYPSVIQVLKLKFLKLFYKCKWVHSEWSHVPYWTQQIHLLHYWLSDPWPAGSSHFGAHCVPGSILTRSFGDGHSVWRARRAKICRSCHLMPKNSGTGLVTAMGTNTASSSY